MTEDELYCLEQVGLHGAAAYPLQKVRSGWTVEGIRGCGEFPCVFKTKREAVARFEGYLDLLQERVREWRAGFDRAQA